MSPPYMEYRPPRARQRPLLPERGGQRLFVAIEGPIGVGKTTLVRRLAEPLAAEVVLEVVEENPFLPHFYQDIRAYAFQTQIFFFLSRYRQQDAIRRAHERGRVVSDYVFAKDRLFAQLNLDPQELDLYDRLFALIAPMTVQPDLILYLTARLKTLLRRIAHRDRPFERAIDPAYLQRLCEAYEVFFDGFDDTAVLRVDTDAVDIFTPADLQRILHYVEEGVAR